MLGLEGSGLFELMMEEREVERMGVVCRVALEGDGSGYQKTTSVSTN